MMSPDIVSVALSVLSTILEHWPYTGVNSCVAADTFCVRRRVVKNRLGCAIIQATKGYYEAESLRIGQRMSTALDNEQDGTSTLYGTMQPQL